MHSVVGKALHRCPPLLTSRSTGTLLNLKPISVVATVLLTQRLSSSTSVATAFTMPSPPYSYLSDGASSNSVLDLSDLETKISTAEEKRQEAYELSRDMSRTILQAKRAIDRNEDVTPFMTKFSGTYLKNPLLLQSSEKPRTPRLASLSSKMEEYARLCAFQHFLKTAELMEPPAAEADDANTTASFTDEEYMGGACMGLAQDLQRYGLGRATVRDVDSVQAAANLVSDILDFLLQLDFRNGPLRRKYDGTKYSLKTLETLLYELAVTSGSSSSNDEEPAQKRAKTTFTLLPMPALLKIKERMEHRDSLRETLIKQCRDDQKAAKQSIFALHRGDKARAMELLNTCYANIQTKLLPIIEQEPPLRGGSFGNVLEEYVEGKLFCVWLYGKDGNNDLLSTGKPSGVILQPEEFEMELSPEDYLGGLCDLTGEIGRYAVQRGTSRDVQGVQLCLDANSSINVALQSIGRLPQGIPKKMDQLRRSVEKLERMLYEMSLSEAAGGRNVRSEVEDPPTREE